MLELGCGLGLCALVASLRGAEVTATGDTLSHGIPLFSHSQEDLGGADNVEPVLELCRSNLEQNGGGQLHACAE